LAVFHLGVQVKLCYIGTLEELFLGSSVVEQLAVNQLVAGSNPARGATLRFFVSDKIEFENA
jgi:hypothetical protein